IREVNAPAGPGLRAEQLEAGGRALSVYRPHMEQHPRTPATAIAAGKPEAQELRPTPRPTITGSATALASDPRQESVHPPGAIRLPNAPLHSSQVANPSPRQR